MAGRQRLQLQEEDEEDFYQPSEEDEEIYNSADDDSDFEEEEEEEPKRWTTGTKRRRQDLAPQHDHNTPSNKKKSNEISAEYCRAARQQWFLIRKVYNLKLVIHARGKPIHEYTPRPVPTIQAPTGNCKVLLDGPAKDHVVLPRVGPKYLTFAIMGLPLSTTKGRYEACTEYYIEIRDISNGKDVLLKPLHYHIGTHHQSASKGKVPLPLEPYANSFSVPKWVRGEDCPTIEQVDVTIDQYQQPNSPTRPHIPTSPVMKKRRRSTESVDREFFNNTPTHTTFHAQPPQYSHIPSLPSVPYPPADALSSYEFVSETDTLFNLVPGHPCTIPDLSDDGSCDFGNLSETEPYFSATLDSGSFSTQLFQPLETPSTTQRHYQEYYIPAIPPTPSAATSWNSSLSYWQAPYPQEEYVAFDQLC